MCELFGFSARKKFNINNVLKAFFSRSEYHPHGWGLVMYGDNGCPTFIKEPIAANMSNYLPIVLEKPVKIDLAIAHIRYATKGKKSISNTHPFVSRIKNDDWFLAHNGTIEIPNSKKENIDSTDSEMILQAISKELILTNCINPINHIETIISKLSVYGKMNLLFTNGQQLFVFSNRTQGIYSLTLDGCVLFSTKPITLNTDTNWFPVAINKLIVFEKGREIYRTKEVLINESIERMII